MNQKLLVMEDSGQSGFGGGQRITLEVLNRGQIPDEIILMDTICADWHRLIKDPGIRINVLNKNEKKELSTVRFIFMTLLYLFKASPDKIYITTRKNFIPALIYKIMRPGVRLVYHFHLSATRNILWRWYDRLVVQFSKHIIFSSEFTYQKFTKMRNFIDRSQGFSISPLPPAKWNWEKSDHGSRLPSDPVVVSYIGRISEEKGIFIFLDAIDLLDETINWTVRIAGDGPARNEMLKRISASRFKEKIEYCGPVNTDKYFYKKITLLIIPSFNIDETICLTALEAMQAGVPVICSTNGNLGVFVREKSATGLSQPDAGYIASVCKRKIVEIEKQNYARVFPRKANESGDNFGAFYHLIFSRI